MNVIQISNEISTQFAEIRTQTEIFTRKLRSEDCIPQPVNFASPAKWHLGHTTWFFEEFVLKKFKIDFKEYDPKFSFLFNSYYKNVGTMVFRADRGNITRPGLDEVYAYRTHVNNEIGELLDNADLSQGLINTLNLGMNHEQQHQELLRTDVKLLLGTNPIFPVYEKAGSLVDDQVGNSGWISFQEGIHEIGYKGDEFCYDNELDRHKIYINPFKIKNQLVSNGEFLEFMNDGGYEKFEYWLDEGWNWCQDSKKNSPKYWHRIDGQWYYYTYGGLTKLDPKAILCHISYYEAEAFAKWKGLRLPTEFEWEVASDQLDWGKRWEWTNSAYLPYPGYNIAKGALGEYNGKFMVNQMVLRGASAATSKGHSRDTYRNFFHPHFQWQFTGIRLAK